MKETGLIYNSEMVLATIEERKWQTRRLVKPQPRVVLACHPDASLTTNLLFRKGDGRIHCPYGRTGDRLWVRETWAAHGMYDDLPPSKARSERADLQASDNRWFRADGVCAPSQRGLPPGGMRGKWRPSILMPRWASRLTLEITSVRVERLQNISEEDAKAEGCEWLGTWRNGYRILWESLYGPGSWDSNPWVWVIAFKLLKGKG